MSRPLKLLLAGFAPLALGYLINLSIAYFYVLPLLGIFQSLLYLFFWGCLAYALCSREKSAAVQALLMCVVGFVCLAVLLSGVRGFLYRIAQCYTTPVLTLAFRLTSPFTANRVIYSMWVEQTCSVAMFFIVSLGACVLKKHQKH